MVCRAVSATDDHLGALRSRVAKELTEPVRPGIAWLAEQVAGIHGDAVAGVLFYGSCLRKDTDEGVLDYWVIVDDYAAAHSKLGHAAMNRIAPPNVYYLEREYEGRLLRTKYGVMDRRAFERGTGLGARHPYVWARFAQPTRLLACRDDEARAFFETCVSQAIVTFVARLFCHLPDRSGLLRFSLPAFWQTAFRTTYDSERRPEADETIVGNYRADEARYDEGARWPSIISRACATSTRRWSTPDRSPSPLPRRDYAACAGVGGGCAWYPGPSGSCGYSRPVSYTHLTLPTKLEV